MGFTYTGQESGRVTKNTGGIRIEGDIMRRDGHRIKNVEEGSIAWELGVLPGMYLISVNGTPVEDVFDYRYLMNDELVNVLIREENGEETLLEIEKESYEDLRSKAKQRIYSMIDYLEKDNNNEEVLLRYFGEKI